MGVIRPCNVNLVIDQRREPTINLRNGGQVILQLLRAGLLIPYTTISLEVLFCELLQKYGKYTAMLNQQ